MSQFLFDHLEELRHDLAGAPHLLVAIDFDGTLVPLADRPEEVAIPPATYHILETLRKRRGVDLVIVSGRALADVQQYFALEGVYLVGNHGLEIAGSAGTFVEPTAIRLRDALAHLVADLRTRVGDIPGVIIEDKGLTASVHYRLVDPEVWPTVRQLVHGVLARSDHPFHLALGHCAYEIRPRVDWHKGDAVEQVREQLACPESQVIYLGDDQSDEEAFAALPQALTIRVDNPGPTSARYYLHDPREVMQFLEWLTGLRR
jgi:trehalose 6-phosphate phosphatase